MAEGEGIWPISQVAPGVVCKTAYGVTSHALSAKLPRLSPLPTCAAAAKIISCYILQPARRGGLKPLRPLGRGKANSSGSQKKKKKA